MNDLSQLISFVEHGDNQKAVAEADRLVLAGVPVKEIISDGLVVALQDLENKCTIENFQLLEVLLSARAMVEVIDQVVAMKIESEMDRIVTDHEKLYGQEKKKTIVIGTIQGDVHDLGKHIVATISSLSGCHVIDLGKDVSPEKFIDAAVSENADIIGVSSLMTVCLPSINKVRPLAKKRGIHPIVVAGGAAVQQAEEGYLDVDYIAFDAFDGLNYFLK